MPRKKKEEKLPKHKEKIIETDLVDMMRDNFLDYAKSTIIDRALPQEDGLKPVQRRILYSMHERGLSSGGRYIKCASTVGAVISTLSPHGDQSAYDALVGLAQNWKRRYPLIDFSGNCGSCDGDPAAAYRYTEHRLSPFGEAIIEDLQYNTVNMVPNFDNTREEPTLLPGLFCNILLNGCDGIATGMATSMLPHYAGDVYKAIDYILGQYLEKKAPDINKIIKIIKAPDFPTGGIIINPKDMPQIYKAGKGKIIVRSIYHIEIDKKKKKHIVFTEIPYGANKASIVESIFKVSDAIDGISDVRDESNKNGIRIVLDLRTNANEDLILNTLFKKTQLESNVFMNNVMIQGNRPKENCDILFILQTFLKHSFNVKLRKIHFLYNRDSNRLKIIEGFLKCFSKLKTVMDIIVNAETTALAKSELMTKLNLTEAQANAIVEKKLGNLTKLNIKSLQAETDILKNNIAKYTMLTTKPEEFLKDIKEDFKNFSKSKIFKNDKRRTQIYGVS